MMSEKIFHYYVEGECEKKLIDEAKKVKYQKLVSGKVEVLNVINKKIDDFRLLTLKKNTIIILVYDIDNPNTQILEYNIEKLRKNGFNNIMHIQSIKNFEDEIVFSSSIRKIEELFNTQGISDFKKKFISHQDIIGKLNTVDFNYQKLWSRVNKKSPFSKYSNEEDLINIKKYNCK